jgi:predicted nucleic acid-binding protein
VRVALDTNVLVYAEGVNGVEMKQTALDLIWRLPDDETVLPAQTLGELFNVLVRKGGLAPASARAALLSWSDTFPVIETSASVIFGATDLATDHSFSIWDAVIVSAAAETGCRILLSEDLQDGFTWHGVTIVNPFAPTQNALLGAVLTAGDS